MHFYEIVILITDFDLIYDFLLETSSRGKSGQLYWMTGSYSRFELSNDNTHPAIALPWGINFRTPQTKQMEDGSFLQAFIPVKWGTAFTEGDSWHWT